MFNQLAFNTLFWITVTLVSYQIFVVIQHKIKRALINPMLLSVLTIIAALVLFDVPYQDYYQSTQWLSMLLEPAVVALGYPLYLQLHNMRAQWRSVLWILSFGAACAITLSYWLTHEFITQAPISISLSLKSITTPIGLALTEQLNGDPSVTAFAIILAGLFGAIWGIPWLNQLNVTSAKAQGLAIGAASHALGTATISQISYQHAAYSSLGLIVSAMVTAFIAPALLPGLVSLFH